MHFTHILILPTYSINSKFVCHCHWKDDRSTYCMDQKIRAFVDTTLYLCYFVITSEALEDVRKCSSGRSVSEASPHFGNFLRILRRSLSICFVAGQKAHIQITLWKSASFFWTPTISFFPAWYIRFCVHGNFHCIYHIIIYYLSSSTLPL